MPLESVPGQIMEAIRDQIRALLPKLDPQTIQVRSNYYTGDTIHKGVSIHLLGESYDDGTIGTHDVLHQIAVTLCEQLDNDAVLTNDSITLNAQKIRRDFVDDRIATLSSTVRQHVVKLAPGNPRLPAKRFPNWDALQLVLNVWTRELPT